MHENISKLCQSSRFVQIRKEQVPAHQSTPAFGAQISYRLNLTRSITWSISIHYYNSIHSVKHLSIHIYLTFIIFLFTVVNQTIWQSHIMGALTETKIWPKSQVTEHTTELTKWSPQIPMTIQKITMELRKYQQMNATSKTYYRDILEMVFYLLKFGHYHRSYHSLPKCQIYQTCQSQPPTKQINLLQYMDHCG